MHSTKWCSRAISVIGCATVLSVSLITSAKADIVDWTDWTAFTPGFAGSASGAITLPDTSTIGITYTGEVDSPTQVSGGGTNYYNPTTPYLSSLVSNAPPPTDIIALSTGAVLQTLTFSTPILDPILAIVSLGQPNLITSYTFNQSFDIISFGPGYWGSPGTLANPSGNILAGTEGHGVIQFHGAVSSISWTVANGEHWAGFTVGQVRAIPEAGTLPLVALGLVAGIGGMVLRKRATG